MNYSIVIPARYASTRLPGKPLLDIAGKPMVQHVYERACASSAERVIVATDDERIQQAVKAFGGDVLMTDTSHQSGTDRLEEVARQLQMGDDEVVVNLQGDEPLLPIAAIEQVATNLLGNTRYGIATLCEKIDDDTELASPNAVKVVRASDNTALYFSRATIPYDRNSEKGFSCAGDGHWFRHLGIYAYRVAVLRQFVSWPVAELEKLEALEQLRALQNGVAIHCAEACEPVPAGVDTAQDLEKVRVLLANRQ